MKTSPLVIHPEPLLKQRQWTQDDIPVLSMTLSLPVCHALVPDTRLRRINRCYMHFARCYENYCETFLLPAAREAFRSAAAVSRPFQPWQAELQFRTTLQSKTVWSLLLEAEESSENGTYRRLRADTWDLRDGYLLTLSDFFPGDPLPLRRIRRIARRELSAAAQQEAALHPDWRFRLRSAAKRENFYLTEDGLRFYYPQFALGGTSLGVPTVLLPWSDAGPVPPAGFSPADTLDKSESEDLS